MEATKFKVYANHEDINVNLHELGLSFLEKPGDIKNDTLAVIVRYLEGDKKDTFEDVDNVILAIGDKDVPVIVLDNNLVPEHSKALWLKKNVVRYLPLDDPQTTWAEVKEYLARRIKHRRRVAELSDNEVYKVGWSVKISPKDFETYNMVSLFVGSMGDFMVELKHLLDAIRPEDIRDNPTKGLDLPQTLELEWAVRNNKEQHEYAGRSFEKAEMEAFLKDQGARALFDRPPDGLTRNHVIIEGETGTGKSIIAEFIHNYVYQTLPKEKRGELKKVNCANLGEKIMETQLFGSLKGAYTDAVTRPGAILEAYNGTAFLDEIGDVPPDLQARLLYYLESQRIQPTGWSGPGIYVPSLIVSATNRRLKQEVTKGTFRRDLHHRLGFTVTLPPLRERIGDLDRLIDFALQNPKINPLIDGKKLAVNAIEREAVDLLKQHEFPGNFRELEQIIRHAVIMAQTMGIKIITEESIRQCLY